MASLEITFINETNRRVLDAIVDSEWSASHIIQALISAEFIKYCPGDEYMLVYDETKVIFGGETTLADVGVENGKTVRIITCCTTG